MHHMDPKSLHVISCIYNPIRWKTRIAHAKVFLQHMLDSGVQVTMVECAMGDRQFELEGIEGVEHIGVRARTLAWNKENLINLGIARSKIRTPYICWADADINFKHKHWASDTIHALQQYAVVQPWSSALDLGPDGEPMLIKGFHVQTSFARVWHECIDIKPTTVGKGPYAAGWKYPHPGYAWAMRRDVLENIGGLIEVSGLGAGDHQMAMSFIGRIDNAIHGQTSSAYQDAIRAWGERAFKYVQGNLSHVGGTVEHMFHGEKNGPRGRKYHERWGVLIEEGYNPITDIKRNLHGVIELAGNKPHMAHRFDQYFRQRCEDANICIGEE